MTWPSKGRNTSIRDKHRRVIRKDKPPCAYIHCLFPGEPIDYEAHYLDPRSYTVDHDIPLSRGGADTLDNKVAMHRACNRDKGDKLAGEHAPTATATWTTDRDWWSAN